MRLARSRRWISRYGSQLSGVAPHIFDCKNFRVYQSREVGLKVTMEAILFGAYATRREDLDFNALAQQGGNFLDIGTGTGILTLMIAQQLDPEFSTHGRSIAGLENSRIDAIDKDPSAHQQASENFGHVCIPENARSVEHLRILKKWRPAFHPHLIDLKGFQGGKETSSTETRQHHFDWIICNPPFHQRPATSRRQTARGSDGCCTEADDACESARDMARFAEHLSIPDLMEQSASLLRPGGILWILQSAQNKKRCIDAADSNSLVLLECLDICFRPSAPPKRIILKFKSVVTEGIDGWHKQVPNDQQITVLTPGAVGEPRYSMEFQELTKAFYVDEMLRSVHRATKPAF